MLNDININDFDYPLTEDRIAKFPLNNRKDSKLLVYRNGDVTDRNFLFKGVIHNHIFYTSLFIIKTV